MRYTVIWMLGLLWMPLLLGCQEQDKAPAHSSGRVEASSAYRAYFGDPPTVAEGTCFALVGFYPLAEDPTRVMPVPHFTFAEANRPQLLMGQVLQGGEPLGMERLFINPFPAGTRLDSLALSAGEAVADFSAELLRVRPEMQQGLLASIGQTLLQFDEIQRVRVTVEGRPLPFAPSEWLQADEAAVVEPGPPGLLQALLHDDEDAVPGEILVFFDRPVEVRSFRLEFPQGQPVKGEYFTSVFDMAVVLHPADPEGIAVGKEVFIAWKIVDGKGREGSGEGAWPLGHLSHD